MTALKTWFLVGAFASMAAAVAVIWLEIDAALERGRQRRDAQTFIGQRLRGERL